MFLFSNLVRIVCQQWIYSLPKFLETKGFWLTLIPCVIIGLIATCDGEEDRYKSLLLDFWTEQNRSKVDVCAHFNASHGKSFDIYDGANYSQGLEDIFETESYEEIYSVDVKLGCAVRLCELVFLDEDPVRKRVCHTLPENTTSLTKYFYIVTTKCSCQEPADHCESENCANVRLEENECVRMFVERECKQCRFNGTSLVNGDTIFPTNGFSTESFVVRKGCRLSIQRGEGKQNQSIYRGIYSNIQLSYVLKPIPSKFICSCDESDDEYFDEPSSTWGTGVLILVISIPLVLLIIIVAGVCFARRKSGQKLKNVKPEEKISKDVFNRFEKGYGGTVQNEFEMSEQTLHYVSVGFTEALQQPYQSRFEVPRANVAIGKLLEKGHFGIVSVGKLKQNDGSIVEVAVKETKASLNPTYFTSLLDEIKILSFIGTHPNVVSLIGACTRDLRNGNPLLLLEFCSEGSLKDYLKKNRSSFLDSITIEMTLGSGVVNNAYTSFESLNGIAEDIPQTQILPQYFRLLVKWAREIAAGMNYLSRKKVVHADLATRNVLLTADFVAKISDFGLSQRLHEVGTYVKIGEEYPLPIRWMALESLTEHRFTSSSDVWSYGVTLWEIFSLGENPYKNVVQTYSELINFLNNEGRLERPLYATIEIYDEMCNCWVKNPETRPSFEDLSSFFASLDDIN